MGAFAACMAGLLAVHGDQVIDRRLAGSRPVLGICVGMQVMFAEGVEHGVRTPGCGQWPGTVERLTAPVLPHMGWNTVEVAAGLGAAGRDGGASGSISSTPTPPASLPLAAPAGCMAPPLVSWACHGEPFIAAVENGPLCATQFHPEKSGDAGAALLSNWLETLR